MPYQPRATIQTFDEGTRLRVLRTTVDDPAWVVKEVVALVAAYSQNAFVVGRLGPSRWKDRDETGMNPNWPAVVADLKAGRKPPARRFVGKPVLIDTGRLASSITGRVVSPTRGEVGTNLPYAGPLHFGTPSRTERITKEIQRRLWQFIKGARRAAANAVAAPARREAKERMSGDSGLQALKASLRISVDAHRGLRLSKGERERQRDLRKQIKDREAFHRSVYGPSDASAKETKRIDRTTLVDTGAQKLRWLLNRKFTGTSKEIRHPVRPMVGIPPDLFRKIERLVGVRVRRGAA